MFQFFLRIVYFVGDENVDVYSGCIIYNYVNVVRDIEMEFKDC